MTNFPSDKSGRYSRNRFDLIDLAIIAAKHKRFLVAGGLLGFLISACYAFFLPNIYTATAKIFPPDPGSQTYAASLNTAGPITGLGASLLGLKNPADLCVGMLRSRVIADKIIQKFDLQKIYNTKHVSEARAALGNSTRIIAGKDGIVVIEVDSKEPQLSADITNEYITVYDKLSQTLAITDARRRRSFFERELKEAKEGLIMAEAAMRSTQESTGVIQPDNQGRVLIGAAADLRAKIASKEVQIGSVRSYATELNPDIQRLKTELTGLRTQLDKLERSDFSKDAGVFVPIGRVPEVGLEYSRKLRDMKYYETISELLAKQYELAKLDEAHDDSRVQVLDPAIPPETHSSPRRRLITIFGGGAIFLSLLFAVYLKEVRDRLIADPDDAERVKILSDYLLKINK